MAAEERTPRINLLLPETENTTWEQEVENWANKLDEVAAGYLTFHNGGEVVSGNRFFDDFLFDTPVDIVKISMSCRVGPVGSPLTLYFLKNGVQQAQTASILSGNLSGEANISGLSYDPGAATPEKMGLMLNQAGGTLAAEITVVVHFNVKPVV